LAVPLELPSSSSSRRWYRPAIEPIPAEPGRLVVVALLGRARRERGCSTPGDDRLETRAYAVKRYLFRLGHAAKSARYATSIGQLVVGLAPVIGWGPVPRERVARAAFVRRHRRSVQRWLDDLQAAGVLEHEPERDGTGVWWRTQIVLQTAPAPVEVELAVARARARTWTARERRRQRTGRRAPALAGIRARSGVPTPATRARVSLARELAGHERRRRAAAEAQIARAHAVASSGDLTHPFGAPPTSAPSLVSAKRFRRTGTSRSEGPAASGPARAVIETVAVVAETGARARAATNAVVEAPAARTAGTEEVRRLSPSEFDALVAERLASHRAAVAERSALLRKQASARIAAVVAWPVGRQCPSGRLREAWVAHRYGLAKVVDCGTAFAGRVDPGLAAQTRRAIALYEAYAAHRPAGWPMSGAAALCALATQRRAAVFAGDVARLLMLAKGMRAVALSDDEARLRRARDRARARRAPRSGLQFRLAAPRYESSEGRRVRVRDTVLLAGADPASWPNAELALNHLPELAADGVRLLEPDRCEELDGVGARATRYRAELARGDWQAPDLLVPTTTEDPQ
jgi:hypothetical protein